MCVAPVELSRGRGSTRALICDWFPGNNQGRKKKVSLELVSSLMAGLCWWREPDQPDDRPT